MRASKGTLKKKQKTCLPWLYFSKISRSCFTSNLFYLVKINTDIFGVSVSPHQSSQQGGGGEGGLGSGTFYMIHSSLFMGSFTREMGRCWELKVSELSPSYTETRLMKKENDISAA